MTPTPRHYWVARYPMLRLVMCFAGGIVSAKYCSVPLAAAYGVWVVLLLVYWASLLLVWDEVGVGSVGLLAFFTAGHIAYVQQRPSQHPHHLLHWATQMDGYEGVVLEEVTGTPWHHHTRLQVKRARINGKWCPVQGQVYVYGKGLGLCTTGARVVVAGRPELIGKPLNPYVFVEQQFFHASGVFYQQQVSKKSLHVIGQEKLDPRTAMAVRLRKYARNTVEHYIDDPDVQAVMLALFTGTRTELDFTLKQTYAAAGAIHLLAASGLHIGLLYMVLLFLFYCLGFLLGRPGRYHFLALPGVWLYAFQVAWTPSVLRAAVMLSLVAVNRGWQRGPFLMNILAVTTFCLLLVAPDWLFTAGLQLSVGAIISMICLEPAIREAWQPKHFLLDRWWRSMAAALSVQIGILPVTFYYFRFFPVYFLLTNCIVVPTTCVVLALGLLLLATAKLPVVATAIAWLLTHLFTWVNEFLNFLTALPCARLGPYHPGLVEVVVFYGVVWMLYQGLRHRKFVFLVCGAAGLSLLAGGDVYTSYSTNRQQQLILYSIPDKTVLGLVNGRQMTFISDTSLPSYSYLYQKHLAPAVSALGITDVRRYRFTHLEHSVPSLHQTHEVVWMVFQGKRILFVSGAAKAVAAGSIDYLIADRLTHAQLLAWLRTCQVGQVVLGNSYHPPQAQALCNLLAHQVGIHALSIHGAFELSARCCRA